MMKKYYAAVAGTDNDEEYLDVVMYVSDEKADAQKVGEIILGYFDNQAKYQATLNAQLAEWKKNNKEPQFKPRVGKLSEEDKTQVALEKAEYAKFKAKLDAYRETIKYYQPNEEEAKYMEVIQSARSRFPFTWGPDYGWETHLGVEEIWGK